MTWKDSFEQHRPQLHEQQANNLYGKPKEFWRYLNAKRKSNGLPEVMNFNEKTAKSDEEKANLFAEYFESV